MLTNYKELKVWQKAYYLCLDGYKTTKTFPKEEIYGLTSQMRRAAISIPYPLEPFLFKEAFLNDQPQQIIWSS
jgi:hypothetical protein